MVKIYVAMLFTTLIAFQVSGLYQDFNSYDFDQVNANVQEYADNTAGLYESGLVQIVDTVSGTIDIANGFVDAILFIPNAFDTTFGNAEGLGDVCTAYADQSPIQRAYLSASRTLYNLINNPNIETNEAYWIYEQERIYGLVCS